MCTRTYSRILVIDKENWSDPNERAMEDNAFANNKTFLSIDARFALNATSMLDQTKNSIRVK